MPSRITGNTTNSVVSNFPIRPMYGIAIRDDLMRFRVDIGTSAGEIRDALSKGKPNAKEKTGDNVLQGKEYQYAAKALKELEKAQKSLKSVPSLRGAPVVAEAATRATTNFPIRPMYGIAIRDDLQRFRTSINANIAELSQAIAKGSARKKAVPGDGVLQGTELAYAKKALAQLQAAATALKSVPPSW